MAIHPHQIYISKSTYCELRHHDAIAWALGFAQWDSGREALAAGIVVLLVLPSGVTVVHHISYSYFKHIYTGYKFNKYIVLQFHPVQIRVPNKLFTNKLDENIYI